MYEPFLSTLLTSNIFRFRSGVNGVTGTLALESLLSCIYQLTYLYTNLNHRFHRPTICQSVSSLSALKKSLILLLTTFMVDGFHHRHTGSHSPKNRFLRMHLVVLAFGIIFWRTLIYSSEIRWNPFNSKRESSFCHLALRDDGRWRRGTANYQGMVAARIRCLKRPMFFS